ncbi:hypothetical protein ES708_17392 [subsurface metagenome]
MTCLKLLLAITLLIVTLPAANAEPGDILAQYDVPYNMNHGMAWDPDHNWMWGLNHQDPPCLYAIDPENGEDMAEFPVANRMIGLFYLDGVLCVGGHQADPNAIFRYDTEGNDLENWDSPVSLASSWIASDGEFLFTNNATNSLINVFDLDGMQEVSTIDFSEAVGGAQIWAIEWVTAHPRGQLWLFGDGHLYECFIDGDWNCELVQDFETIVGAKGSIAHDGENLWYAVFNGERIWYVIDDGVGENGWLAYDPTEGEVEGEGQQEVNVTINAAGLIQGDYDADMIFVTNEPLVDDVVVNVLIHVTGAPVLTVIWPEEFGFNPDDPEASIIDWNLGYEDLYTDVPYDVTVTVSNTGTADLEIDGIFCEDLHFIPDADQFVLSHDESADVIITFVTGVDEAGLYESVMSFTSNDPANPEIDVALRAEALQPPEIRIEPISIEDELFTGQVEVYPITVFNDGQAPLRFTITHEIISEPQQVGDNRNPRARSPHRNGNSALFK